MWSQRSGKALQPCLHQLGSSPTHASFSIVFVPITKMYIKKTTEVATIDEVA
jgi:hypothetical protein